MKTLYESLLDDEEDLIKDEGFLKKHIKSILNTQADIKINGNDIKITSYRIVIPLSNFITLKDYTFTDIPALTIGTSMAYYDDASSGKKITNYNLFDSNWIKSWPHIKHIEMLTIYITETSKNELDLTDLNVDNIDTLVIYANHVKAGDILYKGPKLTKINRLIFTSTSVVKFNPHLIKNFNCKLIIFQKRYETFINGIYYDYSTNQLEISDSIEFDELNRWNRIGDFIGLKIWDGQRYKYFKLEKDKNNWIYKKNMKEF